MRRLLVLSLAVPLIGFAQDTSKPAPNTPTAEVATTPKITLPAGTQIPLRLKQAISTKSAKTGDPVYAETNFPITLNNKIVIPAGTYVQGRISEIRRPGRVKGKALVLMHFTTLVFPSGYTALLPGAVENIPGSENQHVKGEEGSIEQNSNKGHDAATIGEVAATGASVGAIAGQGIKGAAVGGLAGAGVGTLVTLLTRGPDVMLPEGTGVEMVLQRPLTLDEQKVARF